MIQRLKSIYLLHKVATRIDFNAPGNSEEFAHPALSADTPKAPPQAPQALSWDAPNQAEWDDPYYQWLMQQGGLERNQQVVYDGTPSHGAYGKPYANSSDKFYVVATPHYRSRRYTGRLVGKAGEALASQQARTNADYLLKDYSGNDRDDLHNQIRTYLMQSGDANRTAYVNGRPVKPIAIPGVLKQRLSPEQLESLNTMSRVQMGRWAVTKPGEGEVQGPTITIGGRALSRQNGTFVADAKAAPPPRGTIQASHRVPVRPPTDNIRLVSGPRGPAVTFNGNPPKVPPVQLGAHDPHYDPQRGYDPHALDPAYAQWQRIKSLIQ